MARFLFVFLIMIATTGCAASDNAVAVHRIAAPVVIDGSIEEGEWTGAAPIPFQIPVTLDSPATPAEGHLLWDAQALYVAITAPDRELMATVAQRDGQTWRDDCLEVFLMPPGDEGIYYNFEINPLGTVYDARNVDDGPRSAEWNGGGVRIELGLGGTVNDDSDEDRGWTLEMAIPFACFDVLQGDTPKPGDTWRFHLARYDYAAHYPDGKELSSTAPLTRVHFHLPEQWNTLVFDDSRGD